MKKFLIVCAAVCCAALMAAPAAPKGWSTDYNGAVKQAAKEKKFVLVLFTGSDWCGWCKKLHKDTLDQAAFKKFADQKLILVYMDMPREQTLADRAKVQDLAGKLKAGGGVPCTVIVDRDGRVRGKIVGYRALKSYMNELAKLTK